MKKINWQAFFKSFIDTMREPTTTATWFNSGGINRQRMRAKTFSGIAQAMAEQWGKENPGV